MPDTPKRLSRVLTNLHHGGRAVGDPETEPAAVPTAGDETALADVVEDASAASLEEISTPFGYLFEGLKKTYPAAHLPIEPASSVVAGLKALGSAMVDAPPDGGPNSAIAPVFTYWGQFVDHDLTANTDRDAVIGIDDEPLTPIEPALVPGTLRNLREPALNLDSVYGNGPGRPDVDDEVPFDGIKFRIGTLTPINLPPQVAVEGADLPRSATTGKARIADSRNDENLIVAQLHLAFLKFHNAAVEWVKTNETGLTDDEVFARARQLTTWHYQWITVENFLRTVALSSAVDEALAVPEQVVNGKGDVFMPLEHSVAAYRFGHSMVRARYDHNENFGRLEDGTEPPVRRGRLAPQRAEFEELFQFTGNDFIQGPDSHLPNNWPIRWKRFTDRDKDDRFARKIDTHLAPPLTDLANEGNGPRFEVRVRRILKRLAVRNLLRGYRLGLPTGQAVAKHLGVDPLTEAELLDGAQGVADALVDGGFLEATPLWFYVLKEAEVREQGQRLGEVGSKIVCATIVGQVKADDDSYLNRGAGWTPTQGVKLTSGGEVNSIRTFLEFAGVLI
jgi:hypothetical protein